MCAVIAMIYGQSGTGKSASLRNFEPNQVGIINVSGKPFPFRKNLPAINTDNYQRVWSALQNSKALSMVIDDSTYLMTDEFMRTAKTTGYQKFSDMAKNFFDTLEIARALPDDRIIYFMGHSNIDDSGNERFKTIGKMLDGYVTVEGKFSIVLKTVVTDGHYQFSTHNSGTDTVKTPIDMFQENLIDNDLAAVDRTIREYYGMTANAPEAANDK